MLLNRRPALPERGKIKIGGHGELRQGKSGPYRLPVKYDHFVVTSLAKDANDNFAPDLELMRVIAERTGQDATRLTRLPVRLLYNDPELNFASRYAAFDGKAVWCAGNGETAQRIGRDGQYQQCKCPCPNLDAKYAASPASGPKCKIAGMLNVLIDGAPGVGGVWKFRTTSFNSVDGLTASLMFLAGVTGGQLANIPLDLVVGPKQVADPSGKPQTVYVVGLVFRGTVDELRDAGYRSALDQAQAGQRIINIEHEARRLLEGPPPTQVFAGEEPAEVADEYYPGTEAEVETGQEAPTPGGGTDAGAASPASARDGAPPPMPRARRTRAPKAEVAESTATNPTPEPAAAPEQTDIF